MKFRKTILSLAAGTALFTAGCDNEIDITAPYKEIGVIYGLINPADSIHYVRIQKAFLGDGNANTMAQVTDSIYYPDILDVQLQRVQNGVVLSSFPLTRFVAQDKEEGVFPRTPNILYKSNGEVIARDSEYKIVVKNTQTGHEFFASTPIVDSMRIVRPSRNANSYVQFSNDDFPYNVEFVSAKNGKVHNLVIKVRYSETVIGSAIVDTITLDWNFGNILVKNPEVVETIRIAINGVDFYKFLDQKIPYKANVAREIGSLDFIFTAGEEFLANYVSINQATTSILTSTPYYSNVTGGTGIFSSRFIQVVPEKELDMATKQKILTSPYTSDLGFQ